MPESLEMTNLQLQDDILKNLLLGLQKQSQFYVQKINETGELTEDRKNFEKELSDINKVLTELSNKALSYTVQELDSLRTQFNNKLLELNAVITDLEINTLKIEFNSLTPEQKQFLKGDKGDKGDKGLNPYEFAVMFGFMGTESDYLSSLKGEKGDTGLKGADGQSGINGTPFTYDMFSPEQLVLLMGADGQNGINGKDFTYDMFTPEQLALLKGANGINGIDGINGVDGSNGIDGKDFTYNDFTPEQLALLKGADGQNGTNGVDGTNGTNGTNGLDGSVTFESLTPEQLALLKGEKGDIGLQGLTGQDGLSAYEVALDNGFVGSQTQWLESLKGADGQNGVDGQSLTYANLTEVEKQDLASHVTLSGGGSSLNQTLGLETSGGGAQTFTHYKTNLKFTKDLFFKYDIFTPFSAYKLTSGYIVLSLDSYTNSFKKSQKILNNDHSFDMYISSDGFVCFLIDTDSAHFLSIVSYFSVLESFSIVQSLGSNAESSMFGVFSGSSYPII